MKITKIHLMHLRNNEYFQFHTEFRLRAAKHDPEALGIAALLAEYAPLYEKIDEALQKILKSALTKKIDDAHKARNRIWRGLTLVNSAALLHFEPSVAAAARRVKIVIDTYGNIARKPIDEATSAYYNILQEFEGKYAEDMETTGARAWAAELQKQNIALGALVGERYRESAAKTDTVLKDARAELDRVYREIIKTIEAQALIAPTADREEFIRALNIIISRYAATLAVRTGRTAAQRAALREGSEEVAV